ncbi:uncharacterized protein LOC129252984 [Anastrepha obliqua]|uniref:uncharacterized protein LOC129252984 n=1 Tax=Anastrepha obliqua TaxID=95512 RepID=UPI002409BB10|nr:uncharacterized protein LOC129252984 [Anastrepha obliqua]
MDKCTEDKQFILKFIENYQCLPALWNAKVEAYCDREEKAKQYEILLEIYKERYPSATVEDVKKKINVLRTNLQREKQRLAEISRSGAGSEESLETNLFYYDEMEFLSDMETPCSSKSSTGSKNLLTATRRKEAKRKPDAAEALVEIATKRFSSKDRNKTTVITDSWAVKLERMAPNQRILCEKFVEDILFEGQMGTLHRNSLQINAGYHPIPSATSHTGAPTPTSRSNNSTPLEFHSHSSNSSNNDSES